MIGSAFLNSLDLKCRCNFFLRKKNGDPKISVLCAASGPQTRADRLLCDLRPGEARGACDVEGVVFRQVGIGVVVDDGLQLIDVTDTDQAADAGGSGALHGGVEDAAAAHFGQGFAVQFFACGKVFESQHDRSPELAGQKYFELVYEGLAAHDWYIASAMPTILKRSIKIITI